MSPVEMWLADFGPNAKVHDVDDDAREAGPGCTCAICHEAGLQREANVIEPDDGSGFAWVSFLTLTVSSDITETGETDGIETCSSCRDELMELAADTQARRSLPAKCVDNVVQMFRGVAS